MRRSAADAVGARRARAAGDVAAAAVGPVGRRGSRTATVAVGERRGSRRIRCRCCHCSDRRRCRCCTLPPVGSPPLPVLALDVEPLLLDDIAPPAPVPLPLPTSPPAPLLELVVVVVVEPGSPPPAFVTAGAARVASAAARRRRVGTHGPGTRTRRHRARSHRAHLRTSPTSEHSATDQPDQAQRSERNPFHRPPPACAGAAAVFSTLGEGSGDSFLTRRRVILLNSTTARRFLTARFLERRPPPSDPGGRSLSSKNLDVEPRRRDPSIHEERSDLVGARLAELHVVFGAAGVVRVPGDQDALVLGVAVDELGDVLEHWIRREEDLRLIDGEEHAIVELDMVAGDSDELLVGTAVGVLGSIDRSRARSGSCRRYRGYRPCRCRGPDERRRPRRPAASSSGSSGHLSIESGMPSPSRSGQP